MAAKKKRRTFTPEYKAEVVALVQKGGTSVGQIARDLALTETSVRGWVRQAEVDAGGGDGICEVGEGHKYGCAADCPGTE